MIMCFILTMWYVNLTLHSTLYHLYLRFILTMWYVNTKDDDLVFMQYTGFYINYVVCK